ncbi:MAG TPA: hypothetical protein VGM69_12315 [Chloroflexota bacterium]
MPTEMLVYPAVRHGVPGVGSLQVRCLTAADGELLHRLFEALSEQSKESTGQPDRSPARAGVVRDTRASDEVRSTQR